MARNKSASAVAPKPPAPEEWDFRFVKPHELEVVTVYEYARSCPWIRITWERWLQEAIPTYEAEGSARLGTPERYIRDVIRQHFDSELPIWDRAGVEAKAVMFRIPNLLCQAALDYLVCCTPSFPYRWTELPAEERTAALSLARGGLPVFRDVTRPAWSAKFTFCVAVELEADFKDLRTSAEQWLARTKDAYDLQRRRSRQLPKAKQARNHNPGRRAAPRPEALSWLGSYRFSEAGITFPQVEKVVQRRRKSLPDPGYQGYPKLWTDGMNSGTWSDWGAKARRVMEGIFKPRPFLAPSCRLPYLRWEFCD